MDVQLAVNDLECILAQEIYYIAPLMDLSMLISTINPVKLVVLDKRVYI